MKTLKLFIAVFVMAVLPMLFTSCDEKNKPISIVGEWECIDATLKLGTDPTGGEDSSEKGQIWKFDETMLIIDGASYAYELSGNKLETKYAELYESEYFSVNSLTDTKLNLSASYESETKVGKTTITVTLDFVRTK